MSEDGSTDSPHTRTLPIAGADAPEQRRVSTLTPSEAVDTVAVRRESARRKETALRKREQAKQGKVRYADGIFVAVMSVPVTVQFVGESLIEGIRAETVVIAAFVALCVGIAASALSPWLDRSG